MPTPLADIASIPGATAESIMSKWEVTYGDNIWKIHKRADYFNDLRAALANARKNKNINIVRWLAPKVFFQDVYNGLGGRGRIIGDRLLGAPTPDSSYPAIQDLLNTFGDAIAWGDLSLVQVLYDADCHSMNYVRDLSKDVAATWEEDAFWGYSYEYRSFKVIPNNINEPCNKKKQTPLMVAAEQGLSHIIDFLLAKNATCSIQNMADKSQTALIYALSHGHHKAAEHLIGCAQNCFADSDFKYLVDHDHIDLLTLMIGRGAVKANNQNLKLLFDKKLTDLLDCMAAKLDDKDILQFIEDPRDQEKEKEYRLYLRYILNCREANRLADKADSKKVDSPADPRGEARIKAMRADSKAFASALHRNEINFRHFIRNKKDKHVCLMIRHKKVEPKDEDFLVYFDENRLDSLALVLAELPIKAIQKMLEQQQDKQPAYCSYLKYILALREFEKSARTSDDYKKLGVAILQVDSIVEFTPKYAAEIQKCYVAPRREESSQLDEKLAFQNPYACMMLSYSYVKGTHPDLSKAIPYMQRAARILTNCKEVAVKMASDWKAQQSESKKMPPPLAPSAGSVTGMPAVQPSAPALVEIEGRKPQLVVSSDASVKSSPEPSAPPAEQLEGEQAPQPLVAVTAEPPKDVLVLPAPSAAPAPVPASAPLLVATDPSNVEAKLPAALKEPNVFELVEQLKAKAQSLASLGDALKLQAELFAIQQIVNQQAQLLAPAAAKTEKLVLPFFRHGAPVVNPMAPLSSDPKRGVHHTT